MDALRPYTVLDSSKITNSLVAVRSCEVSGAQRKALEFHEVGPGVVGFRSQQAQTGTISFEFNLVLDETIEVFDIADDGKTVVLEASLVFISRDTRATTASELVPLKTGSNRVEIEVDARVIGQKFLIRTVILSREKFQEELPALSNYVLYEDRLTFSTGGQRDSLNIRQVPFDSAGYENDLWRVLVELPDTFEEIENYSISRAVAVEVNSNVLGPDDMTATLTVLLLSDIASGIVDKLVERSADQAFFSQLQQLLVRKMRGAQYFRGKSLLSFIHLVISEVFILELGANRELSQASFVESWVRNRQFHLGIWRSKWSQVFKVKRSESSHEH
jgi:hypothetical protein